MVLCTKKTRRHDKTKQTAQALGPTYKPASHQTKKHTTAASQPADRPASQPANRQATKSASQPTGHQVSQLTDSPVTQPANRQTTKSASRPTGHQASQQSQSTDEPANQPTNQPANVSTRNISKSSRGLVYIPEHCSRFFLGEKFLFTLGIHKCNHIHSTRTGLMQAITGQLLRLRAP